MGKQPPPDDFDENPEWTEEDFARAILLSELPPKVVAALIKKGGRPKGSDKKPISLRVDEDVLARFKADGDGWQTRMNAALRKAVGL